MCCLLAPHDADVLQEPLVRLSRETSFANSFPRFLPFAGLAGCTGCEVLRICAASGAGARVADARGAATHNGLRRFLGDDDPQSGSGGPFLLTVTIICIWYFVGVRFFFMNKGTQLRFQIRVS